MMVLRGEGCYTWGCCGKDFGCDRSARNWCQVAPIGAPATRVGCGVAFAYPAPIALQSVAYNVA